VTPKAELAADAAINSAELHAVTWRHIFFIIIFPCFKRGQIDRPSYLHFNSLLKTLLVILHERNFLASVFCKKLKIYHKNPLKHRDFTDNSIQIFYFD